MWIKSCQIKSLHLSYVEKSFASFFSRMLFLELRLTSLKTVGKMHRIGAKLRKKLLETGCDGSRVLQFERSTLDSRATNLKWYKN
jgi:hypothetical protein